MLAFSEAQHTRLFSPVSPPAKLAALLPLTSRFARPVPPPRHFRVTPPTAEPPAHPLPTTTQKPNRLRGKDMRSRGSTEGSSRRQSSQSQPPSSCRSSSGSVRDMAATPLTSAHGGGNRREPRLFPPLSQQPPRLSGPAPRMRIATRKEAALPCGAGGERGTGTPRERLLRFSGFFVFYHSNFIVLLIYFYPFIILFLLFHFLFLLFHFFLFFSIFISLFFIILAFTRLFFNLLFFTLLSCVIFILFLFFIILFFIIFGF